MRLRPAKILAMIFVSCGLYSSFRVWHSHAQRSILLNATDSSEGSHATPKLDPDLAAGRTCEILCDNVNSKSQTIELINQKITGKQITVSSLVETALRDQLQSLLERQNDLERWSQADQAQFTKWFGTNSLEARAMIYERIRVLILLNQEYSVGNFRKVIPSRVGLYAFVRPADPSKIFVDQEFVMATPAGKNSRSGTITHEMSHFLLAGSTKDFAYGVDQCKRLARLSPVHALANADNLEFFVENVR